MKDILKDVVKHTHDLGFIEAVKLEGNDSGTHIEAMETERQVVLYGKLHNDVPDLSGTSGASNLGYLKWLLTVLWKLIDKKEMVLSNQLN